MSTAAVKIYNLRQVICLLVSSLGTAIILSGCSANGFQSSTDKWKTYKNPRYGFEFTYPSHWTAIKSDNNDGVKIVPPENPDTEIRAWASREMPELQNQEPNIQIDKNFETIQGISGVLAVQTDQKISSMQLTITHKQVKYHWQAQTNHQDFQTHYPLFSYIAKEYKVQPSEIETGKK